MKLSITSGLTLALLSGALQAADPAKPATAESPKPAPGNPIVRQIGGATPGAVPGANPESQRDQQSYRFGFNVGNTLKRQASKINPADFGAGLSEGLKSGTNTDEQLKTFVASFEKVITQLAAEEKEMSEKNKELSQNYLKDNAKKEGVVTLPSGLQYRVLKEGQGDSPKATDEVSVNYRGTLIDGTEFDSSYKRGEPASFPVNRVIKGWTEALQKMKPGAKWELVIPSDLAYGEAGTGQQIGPNATLVFEVELLSVKPAPAANPAQPAPQFEIKPK